MKQKNYLTERFILRFITIGVIGNGLLIISGTLLAQLRLHTITDDVVSLRLISGLSLVYLGMLLYRRKRAAWIAAVALYVFILALNTIHYYNHSPFHHPLVFVQRILLPLTIVVVLVCFRRFFAVKSAIQNFDVSLKVIGIMLAVILAYGSIGYELLDTQDFHQEISVIGAIHHTIDQFGITTHSELVPYTNRASRFVDTLNILSATALVYMIISLFQPVRFKLSSLAHNRDNALKLLGQGSNDSEDFFKIWPTDKSYFSGERENHQTTIAYRVQRGVALVVGDPIGKKNYREQLVIDFVDFSRLNDWLPAFIHLPKSSLELYRQQNFATQKIGEEAVVDVTEFCKTTSRNKYFRQIKNKFDRQGYSWELLTPPHQITTIGRLREVSSDWLTLPGRQERGFVMGYFSEDYLQQCNLLVARDSAGMIQAFINQVPTYQSKESNYDLLRHTSKSLGNVNDYLLMAFFQTAQQQGFRAVNLGLCPLSGLVKQSDEKSVINSVMAFVYSNGDRFYSFNGLRRFKSKYEPTWRSRYIAYKGGVRGFSRIMYALNKVMNHEM